MTPAVLGLVLAAAVSHALWNLAAKSVTGRGYAFVLAYHSLSAILLAPIAVGLLATGRADVDLRLLMAAAVTAVLHIGYSVSLQTGYDHAPLGVVYPTARGTGPVITIVVAVMVFGERPSPLEILGGLIVVAGIAVVTIGSARRRSADPAIAAGGEAVSGAAGHGFVRGLAWGGLIGTFIAAYTLWDDFSVNHVTDSPVLYFALSEVCVTVLMTVGILAAPGVRTRRSDFASIVRGHRAAVVIVAVLSPLAYLLVLFAMQRAPVSLVAPVRESSIVIGTLLAWWLFGERHVAPKLFGALAVLAGIGCIALG